LPKTGIKRFRIDHLRAPVSRYPVGSSAGHFDVLEAGHGCVTTTLDEDDNTAILIPGGWMRPPTTGAIANRSVVLAPCAEVQNIDFGWDYQ
jgi:hypothetical protein